MLAWTGWEAAEAFGALPLLSFCAGLRAFDGLADALAACMSFDTASTGNTTATICTRLSVGNTVGSVSTVCGVNRIYQKVEIRCD